MRIHPIFKREHRKSPLKHWIHFLLSSLWPPTSNMLWKDDRRQLLGCKEAMCTSLLFCVAIWPAAQLPEGHGSGPAPGSAPAQSFLWSQPLPAVTRLEFRAIVSLYLSQCLKSFSSSQASQILGSSLP